MSKVFSNITEMIADVRDGATIAIGGFFAAGVPRLLLRALIKKGVKNLTLASGAGALVGASEEMLGLVRNKQIKKFIDSYALSRSARKGLQDPFEQQVRAGGIELEIHPLGTLAEKFRAAAAGIPAFYTPTGAGSVVEETVITNHPDNAQPKEVRVIQGKNCVLEYALKPDFAFIHAHKGDRHGNLRYRKTARNFNHVMATAAQVTVAEVENLVEPGELDPDDVHTPGIYVHRLIAVERITYRVGID
jgi:3-oxoacid CoA-transferase A subunit